jgi:hypothetical protein
MSSDYNNFGSDDLQSFTSNDKHCGQKCVLPRVETLLASGFYISGSLLQENLESPEGTTVLVPFVRAVLARLY